MLRPGDGSAERRILESNVWDPTAGVAFGSADVERLRTRLSCRVSALRIRTDESEEALAVVREAAGGHQVWRWSVVTGVVDAKGRGAEPIPGTMDPAAALVWLSQGTLPAVATLLDLSAHVEEPAVLRGLLDLVARFGAVGSHLVLVDHSDRYPAVVNGVSEPFELSMPGDAEVESLVRETLKEANRERPIEIELSRRDYGLILKNLAGLSRRQVRRLVNEMVMEDRRLDAEDLNHLLAAKRRLVEESGALSYVESPAALEEVGGLARLKRWLKDRDSAFGERAQEFGLRPPRGVLLLGVQGAGKSLCAKAIATAWGRPLLRLDPGSLYDRYVGESERRLRNAFRHAEAVSPCVLWIDEIEKGFASAAAQSTDGGLSQRMFGALLTWMQDHDSPVFLVATANSIEALPPELLRKGRFDEVFFVDLPSAAVRALILSIHLKKRKRDPGGYDLDRLAALAEGFSGAELEQAVASALTRAFAADRELSDDDLAAAIDETVPLSVTMAERVAELRRWAAERCVLAD